MLDKFSRLLPWLLWSVVLSVAALYVQANYPGNVLAVTLYKMHLMSLGGWGGYWLDRALFPYDRPHEYLQEGDLIHVVGDPNALSGIDCDAIEGTSAVAHGPYGVAMLRRAIIVAASLLCVGLGA